MYDKKLQFNKRRMRILMRGVKIGQKQTVTAGKMGIFDTKKAAGTTPPK
jgi:GTP cyclohydrolase I